MGDIIDDFNNQEINKFEQSIIETLNTYLINSAIKQGLFNKEEGRYLLHSMNV